jgi:hypothetical protein
VTSVADILAARKPRTRRVRFLFDGDLADEIERTRSAVRRAVAEGSALQSADVREHQTKLEELEAAAEAATVEFVFHAIARSKLDALTAAHPPTDEQWARYRERVKANPLLSPPEFDPEAFAPSLIAAACFEPKMSEGEASDLWAGLSDGEAGRLFEAAWAVQKHGSDRPLSQSGTSGT